MDRLLVDSVYDFLDGLERRFDRFDPIKCREIRLRMNDMRNVVVAIEVINEFHYEEITHLYDA